MIRPRECGISRAVIRNAAADCVAALIFPLVRAARAIPRRAHIVRSVLITESLYINMKTSRIGTRVGAAVKARNTDIRDMLSAIGSRIFPRSLTWSSFRAIYPSKRSESSEIPNRKRRIYGSTVGLIPNEWCLIKITRNTGLINTLINVIMLATLTIQNSQIWYRRLNFNNCTQWTQKVQTNYNNLDSIASKISLHNV